MSTRQFALATLAGWATLFFLGFIVYGVLLASFFAQNAGSATGTERVEPLFWSIALGELGLAAALTIVLGKWAKVAGASNGSLVGATLGFLMAVSYDFTIYGTSNILNLTATVADVAVATIRTGLGGAVIGAVLARSK
jgi:uncharacterized membrane protein